MKKEWCGINKGYVFPTLSLRELILSEAHDLAYSIHPGSTKMYHDLKTRFWWYGMKRDVVEYGQSRASTTRRAVLAIENTRMKMGGNQYGLYSWSTQDSVRVGEKVVFGPDMVKEAERQVQEVRNNLKVAQSRQKSYADHRRRELTFEIGDHVYLKVSPIRGLRRFKVKGKLAPRYIGPFWIVDKKGAVAYQLELPAQLSGVHDVFHVSQLKKCLRVPEEQIPLEEVDSQEDLTYSEYLVKILEVSKRVTWRFQKGSLGIRKSECVRSNGSIIQKHRLLGKVKMI
ncbi:hypothetical protein U9M48_039106 [Paspalum notatum var. saurae]|uniref:Integrase zinc-binding domain-containing protein n=1 Tax=Paspalum notatum var. saurae TaxID=547442 RepID=A0AAQ3UMS4_PASNO